jgi:hypothetical protein
MKKVWGFLVSSLMIAGTVANAGNADCTVERINSNPSVAMACDDKEVTHSGMFLSSDVIEMGRVVVLGYDHMVNGKAEMAHYSGILDEDTPMPTFQVGEEVTMTCTVDSGLFVDCSFQE